MAREFSPKVLTANALIEGDVVYMSANGQWTRSMSEAQLITDEGHAKLLLLESEARTDEVVGAYLADAVDDGTGPQPLHFREAFRRKGPSNYFHGKQAEQ